MGHCSQHLGLFFEQYRALLTHQRAATRRRSASTDISPHTNHILIHITYKCTHITDSCTLPTRTHHVQIPVAYASRAARNKQTQHVHRHIPDASLCSLWSFLAASLCKDGAFWHRGSFDKICMGLFWQNIGFFLHMTGRPQRSASTEISHRI